MNQTAQVTNFPPVVNESNTSNKNESCYDSWKKVAKIVVLVVASFFLLPFLFQSFRDEWWSVLGLTNKNVQVDVQGTPEKSQVDSKATCDSTSFQKIWNETKKVLCKSEYLVTIPPKVGVPGQQNVAQSVLVCLPERISKTWLAKEKGGINTFYPYGNAIMKPKKQYETQIEVLNLDSLDAAKKEIDAGRKPVVLNFSTPWIFTKVSPVSASAQPTLETDLCVRSELMLMRQSLNNYKKETDQLIYTPDLTVFREGKANNYQFLSQPYKVSFLTSEAPYLGNDKGVTTREDGKLDYANKIKRRDVQNMAMMQLYAAYENGHDSVILGALGSGDFHNPPDAVAEIYKELIDGLFKGVFKKIVFAVSDEIGATPHSPKRDYLAFKECFEGPLTKKKDDDSSYSSIPVVNVKSKPLDKPLKPILKNLPPQQPTGWRWLASFVGL